MGEVVNVLVAFAVIVFLFRWVTSSSESPEQRSAIDSLGFRPKNVTQDMIDAVTPMFPDIPPENIHFDLLRTGSVEVTTNKVLERGVLEALTTLDYTQPPPGFYTLYPRNTNNQPAGRPVINTTATPKKPKETLLTRYRLEERAQKAEPIHEESVGGKATWEDSAEKREASLRERKAQMILAARQRMLAQQKDAEGKVEAKS
ncbi:hypothetical protein B0H34DRAFT_799458 [Crassisporium funariophilum]|nr:hypothetical protein B0H34DRAFT_799458 [Crassisporium funariophilum]